VGAAAAAIGAAALVLAAASGIVGVVSRGGFFHTPDWQILLTLVAGFLSGACAIAAIRLLERRLTHPLGWLTAIVAPASFVVIAVGTWWLHGWSAHADLLGKLIATVVCTVGIDALALTKIWSLTPTEGDTASATGSAGARLMLVLGILGVLAYLLTPLVDRLELFLPRPRRAEEPSGL